MLPVLVPTSMIVTVVLSSIFLMKKNDVLVSNIFTGNVKTQLGYCRMQYISYESIRQESLSFNFFTVNDLFLKLT